MLAFPPVDVAGITDGDLARAASYLPAYDAWRSELDAFVHLWAGDPSDIVCWRVDAERARRAAGSAALSDADARDYIERFLPAYALWVPALREHPPSRDGVSVPSISAELGRDREPRAITRPP